LNPPAEVRLQTDKQKMRRLAILSNDHGGAFTRVKLSSKVLGTLKKGRQLTVLFSTINGQWFVIPVSLSGFMANFTRLMAQR